MPRNQYRRFPFPHEMHNVKQKTYLLLLEYTKESNVRLLFPGDLICIDLSRNILSNVNRPEDNGKFMMLGKTIHAMLS